MSFELPGRILKHVPGCHEMVSRCQLCILTPHPARIDSEHGKLNTELLTLHLRLVPLAPRVQEALEQPRVARVRGEAGVAAVALGEASGREQRGRSRGGRLALLDDAVQGGLEPRLLFASQLCSLLLERSQLFGIRFSRLSLRFKLHQGFRCCGSFGPRFALQSGHPLRSFVDAGAMSCSLLLQLVEGARCGQAILR